MTQPSLPPTPANRRQDDSRSQRPQDTSEHATVQPPTTERPRLLSGLSPAQIIGGALAAATAAALGARLGVAGTVIGAAFASLIAAVGGKVYSETLRRTHQGISGAVSRQGRAPSAVKAGVLGGSHRRAGAAGQPTIQPVALPRSRGSQPASRPRFVTSAVALSALVSFAIAAIGVTMIETGTGRSLDGSSTTTASRVVETTRGPGSGGLEKPRKAADSPALEAKRPVSGEVTKPASSKPTAPPAADQATPNAPTTQQSQPPAGPGPAEQGSSSAPSAEAAKPTTPAAPPATSGTTKP